MDCSVTSGQRIGKYMYLNGLLHFGILNLAGSSLGTVACHAKRCRGGLVEDVCRLLGHPCGIVKLFTGTVPLRENIDLRPHSLESVILQIVLVPFTEQFESDAISEFEDGEPIGESNLQI